MIYTAHVTGDCIVHASRAPSFTLMLKEGRFDLSITSQQPRGDLARELLRLGASPNDKLQVFANGKPAWKPETIAAIAMWIVEDSPSVGINRRRHRDRNPFQE